MMIPITFKQEILKLASQFTLSKIQYAYYKHDVFFASKVNLI